MENNRAIMLSNWYSGATLLAILLNRHSSLLCNGESFPFSSRDETRYDCTCGQYLDNCPFFKAAAKHMWLDGEGRWDRRQFSQLPEFSRIRPLNSLFLSASKQGKILRTVLRSVPQFQRVSRRFVQAHLEFESHALEYSGKKIYVDGTKSIRRAQIFADSIPNVQKAIHLVRDGRGFCFSYLKNMGLQPKDLSQACHQWVEYIHLVDNLKLNYPSIEIKTIRYEDLCKDPDKLLAEVFEFLGVPHEKVLESAGAVPEHLLGNRMRKKELKEIVEDRKWMTGFDQGTQRKAEEAVKKELERFEYLYRD